MPIHEKIKRLKAELDQFITVDLFIEFDEGYCITACKEFGKELKITACNKKTDDMLRQSQVLDCEIAAIETGVL